MAKRKKYKGVGGFNVPMVVVRTPEQHRAIIQPQREAKPIAEPRFRLPRSKAKRVRLANAGNGTASISARTLALGLRNYADYLLTSHWLSVKDRWKTSKLFKGWVCHSFGCNSKRGLALHHWTYERLGKEELSDLVLVCEDCHRRIHRLERNGTTLARATYMVTKNTPFNYSTGSEEHAA